MRWVIWRHQFTNALSSLSTRVFSTNYFNEINANNVDYFVLEFALLFCYVFSNIQSAFISCHYPRARVSQNVLPSATLCYPGAINNTNSSCLRLHVSYECNLHEIKEFLTKRSV